MKKSKSFSNYGRNLEIRTSKTTNPEILQRNIRRAQQNPMTVTKSQPKWIEGFDRLTGRDKPNSFQIFNTRDFCRQANYDVKEQLVQTRNSFYPVRKQKIQRLNLLFTAPNYQRNEHICKKMPSNQNNEHILTTRDLQQFRKSHHSMDFEKQLIRSNSYIKKPVGVQHVQQGSSNMQATKKPAQMKKKQDKNIKRMHSFDSYTKRDFLQPRKLSVKGAPFYSGADSFKIPMQKYKGSWKTVGQQQFSKSPDKHLSRYDSINQPFYTKLGYHPKQNLVVKKTPIFNIEQQSSRKLNEVHSKYPIRLTI